MKLTGQLLDKYLADPKGTDEEVRAALKLPDNKYYSVTVECINNPESVGTVYITKLSREVKAKKISKSNQPENKST